MQSNVCVCMEGMGKGGASVGAVDKRACETTGLLHNHACDLCLLCPRAYLPVVFKNCEYLKFLIFLIVIH